MKKTNRFAMLALVGGVLASALVMGCGGGETETTDASGTSGSAMNGGAGNGGAMNGGASNGGAGNAPGAPAQ